MTAIDKSTRFTNYLIDMIVIVVLWVVILLIFQDAYIDGTLLYLTMFFYYFLTELIFRQTLGKLVTKTKVVKKDGTRARGHHIFFRSILRLIPIDSISYIFGTERGFHDVLSSTRLSSK